jgi:hypothetical protein
MNLYGNTHLFPAHIRRAPDAEIDRRRLEAVEALIDISAKFRLGIERGAAFSRAGFIVSNDFIYGLEQFLAGGLHSLNVKEMIKPLAKRVGMLLQDAKEMHLFFGAVQTDVDRVSYLPCTVGTVTHFFVRLVDSWNYSSTMTISIFQTISRGLNVKLRTPGMSARMILPWVFSCL